MVSEYSLAASAHVIPSQNEIHLFPTADDLLWRITLRLTALAVTSTALHELYLKCSYGWGLDAGYRTISTCADIILTLLKNPDVLKRTVPRMSLHCSLLSQVKFQRRPLISSPPKS